MLAKRRLGATNLWVSPIGMGTCQLRLVPRDKALATLRAACAAGIDLFHTSPDYEGALELTLEAVAAEAVRPLILHQGYGPMPHFQHLYRQALESEPSGRLRLFGIACVEDREAVGENVFGRGGMIEFLQREKREGRLDGIFCTTHSGPAGMRRYLEMGVFDAAMIAYNPLGYHLLTYNGAGQREFENMEQIREEIFPLARRHDIGLIIMKPLAGGLLARGKAFPPMQEIRPPAPWTARQVLEWILQEPAIACVVPGMAAPEEVAENTTPSVSWTDFSSGIEDMRRTICSRCGVCDTLCSHQLPVSWLFRDGYIQLFPSETFESPAEMRFEKLHPAKRTVCLDCADRSCACPQGIDIPTMLPHVHQAWSETRNTLLDGELTGDEAIEVIEARIPKGSAGATASVHVRNRSGFPWQTGDAVLRTEHGELVAGLRHVVHPGETTYFTWDLVPTGFISTGTVAIRYNDGAYREVGRWKSFT